MPKKAGSLGMRILHTKFLLTYRGSRTKLWYISPLSHNHPGANKPIILLLSNKAAHNAEKACAIIVHFIGHLSYGTDVMTSPKWGY